MSHHSSHSPSNLPPPNHYHWSFTLIGIALIVYIISIAESLLFPVVFSVFLSFALYPFVSFLIQKKIPRPISILITLLFVFLVLGTIVYAIGLQVKNILEEMPAITQKITELFDKFQNWINEKYKFNFAHNIGSLENIILEILKTGQGFLTTTISYTSSVIFNIFFIPIYVFLMMYYKDMYKNFVFDVVENEHRQLAQRIMKKVQGVIQRYISSLFIVMLIVGTIKTVALAVLGIKNPVFFGYVSAMLTVVPYFGIVTGSLFTATYSYLTTDSVWYPIGVIIIYAVVQFLEGNFITPFIMGNRVDINALVTIFSLLVGGTIWGIPGMILSIPLVAVLKILCDNIETLKPYGKVLGTTIPQIIPLPPPKPQPTEMPNTPLPPLSVKTVDTPTQKIEIINTPQNNEK